jgi:hypothetical protein
LVSRQLRWLDEHHGHGAQNEEHQTA